MIVVIPTNRKIRMDYLSPLIDSGARFIIVDDTEGSVHIDHPNFEVFNWGDRKKLLGSLEIGYPIRNGACRDLGFYAAWRNSDPGEIIIALDDDCEVCADDYVEQVEGVLSDRSRPLATCEGIHLNILDLYEGIPDNLFPRGFPYSKRSDPGRLILLPEASRHVSFGLGLWRGIFDINGIDKLNGPSYNHPDATLKEPSVIIEAGKLLSVCSMNMYFQRELIPAVYQLPMHVEILPGWVVDRYGDIWGGHILKTLMDKRNECLALGAPMIRHHKEGNRERNIWQEHLGHLLNEEFIGLIRTAGESVQPGSYLEMMAGLNEQFNAYMPNASPLLSRYLKHLCPAMEAWIRSLS